MFWVGLEKIVKIFGNQLVLYEVDRNPQVCNTSD